MKPALVLLHGWGVNSRIWDPVLDRLETEFDVTVVDLPGYRSDINYSLEYSLDAVAHEILARAPQKASWVAWSLGATLAIGAAIKQPERFEKLQLVSPTPKFLRSDDWEYGGQLTHFEKMAADFESDYQSGLRKFLLLSVLSKDRSQALPSTRLVRQVTALMAQEPTPSHRTLQAGLNILRDTDLRARLSELTVDTQVIAGDQDHIVPSEASRFLFDQLPNGQSFIPLQAGHIPFLQSPAEYIETLISFIQDPPA